MPKKIGQTKYSTVDRAVTNKTFQSHSIPYEELDEEAEIKKALESDKIEQKEKELLERELEKPFHQRNRALMNKYRGRISESLDGYPSNFKVGGYDIVAVARDDPDIKMNLRPQPWFAKIKFETYKDNKWEFKFPIQREATGDGAEVYKLDGYNTWIYRDGSPIVSMGENESTPYTVLWKFIRGDKNSAKPYLISDDNYNFNFPGFYVTYTRDSSNDKLEEPPSSSSSSTKPVKQHFQLAPDDEITKVGSRWLCNHILSEVESISSLLTTPLPKASVIVDRICVGEKETLLQWLLFREIKDEKIYATILNGGKVAANEIGKRHASAKQVDEFIEIQNKRIRDEFKKLAL